MLWKMEFHCLAFSLCFLLNHCVSTGSSEYHLKKLISLSADTYGDPWLGYTEGNVRTVTTAKVQTLHEVTRQTWHGIESFHVLYIEGKVNGETYQDRKDFIPRDIHFDNGAVIEYTCSYIIEPSRGSFELYWIQEKGPLGTSPVFYGERTYKKKSKIKMTVYKFDSDSTISCVLVNNIPGETILPMKTEIKMLIKDPTEDIQPSTSVAISDGQQFKLECNNESREYAAPSNNKLIITNDYKLQKLNDNEYNGITFYCVNANKKEEDDYVLTERVISNITILNYKGKSPTIVTNAGGVNVITVIIIVVVVKIVILVMLCSGLFFYKKRKVYEEAQNLGEGQHPEPASDTLPRVIYGELQKAQNRRSSSLTEPYAEIVGVTTSASDLNQPPDSV